MDSDENDNKIISLALGDDDNENAFQQNIGLGVDMIFAINDPSIRGRIMGRLKRIFDQFEAQRRYRLISNSVKWFEEPSSQELTLEFKYLNLESDETNTFRKTITANQGVLNSG